MARTVAAHVDAETIARLRAVAATKNRPASQINVLVADLLSRHRNLRPSAVMMIADAVRDGTCPAARCNS